MSLAASVQELYSQELLELLTKIGDIASRHHLRAYAVGGFVRDLLLKRPNFDVDIMVEGDALPFATSVAKELAVECKLIERFHTAHIYLPKLTIDFSSARKEVYKSPGALPEVSFSNIIDDLFRRDFSINAIAMSITPDRPFELVDFFNGAKDLEKGIIRILHPRSFIDDPTRLYRALRFADRFKFTIDAETDYQFDKAIHRGLPSLLSPKRIAAEIDKCFLENKPLTLLSKYQSSGLLAFYHKCFNQFKRPSFSFSVVRPTVTRLSHKYPNISEAAVYWSLLLSIIPLPEATSLLNASGLPHSIVLEATNALNSFSSIPKKLIMANDRISIYKLLHGCNSETMALMMLSFKDKAITDKLNLYINELCSIKPICDGKALIEAGIRPGPQIREIFDQIMEQRLNGIELTRKDEIDLAKRISNL